MSVIAANGRVLATSDPITGVASIPLVAKRADGSIIISTYDTPSNTTYLSVINPQGVATTAGTVTGIVAGAVTVTSNGSAVVLTANGFQSGNPTFAIARISPTNQVQTIPLGGYPGGLPVVSPAGYTYVPVGNPQTGTIGYTVIAPDGSVTNTTQIAGSGQSVVTIATDGPLTRPC